MLLLDNVGCALLQPASVAIPFLSCRFWSFPFHSLRFPRLLDMVYSEHFNVVDVGLLMHADISVSGCFWVHRLLS